MVSADGAEVGSVKNVLGDRDADIFHSVLVKRTSDAIVEILAARVHRITERHLVAGVAAAEANALPAYRRR